MKTEAVSASGRTWTAGDHLTHRFNPELGIGCVAALDGRALIVEFPHSSTKLRLAANTDALIPVDLAPGRPVRITATQEETTVAARLPDGMLRWVFRRKWNTESGGSGTSIPEEVEQRFRRS